MKTRKVYIFLASGRPDRIKGKPESWGKQSCVVLHAQGSYEDFLKITWRDKLCSFFTGLLLRLKPRPRVKTDTRSCNPMMKSYTSMKPNGYMIPR